MLVSIDGGGLCASKTKRFGNYTFSLNMIEALANFDRRNKYIIYSFCNKTQDLILPSNFKYQQIPQQKFWLSGKVSLAEFINKKDIFLALSQAIPFTKAKVIVFSHGLSFLFYKDFYSDSYNRLKNQLNQFISRADVVIVSSSKVKAELKILFPNLEPAVLLYGIPFDYQKSNKKSIRKEKPFFLFVGMNHPIKNVKFLVNSFKVFRRQIKYQNFDLYLVGDFMEFADKKAQVFSLGFCERQKIKNFYARATAYLTSSLYESFNLPVLEALSQNCQVIGLKSAIIPELEKYVYSADNFDEFVQYMSTVASGKTKSINPNELQNKFSWNNYIEHLTSFY